MDNQPIQTKRCAFLATALALTGVGALCLTGCGSGGRTIGVASPTPGASATPTPVPTTTPTPVASPSPTPSPSPSPGVPTFTATTIGPYKGGDVSASSLNNVGQVTALPADSNNPPDTLLLNTNGVYQDFGTPSVNAPDVFAHGLNDAGNFVGSFLTDISADARGSRPFLVENGAIRALGIYTGRSCYAIAINNKEQIVGYADRNDSAFGDNNAYLYDSGTVTDLGFLYGATPPTRTISQTGVPSIAYVTNPRDINDAGQIVGESTAADGQTHAFLWQNGKMTDLYTASNGLAYAINNKGQAVGYARAGTFDGPVSAFLFENGGAQALPLRFNGITPALSYATDINDAGQIVGYYTAPGQSGDPRPFFYDHGVLVDLTASLPETGYISAPSINNKGQILISQVNAPSYLLTPITGTKAAKIVDAAKVPTFTVVKSAGHGSSLRKVSAKH